ncbi:TIGR03986 family CRISPR-associated RAMP protein [Kordia sp.]|uniref:TIGR03986 family type III CRISPR-associated RAMP protein n=1 Tax=Kordia sp. TaxID=1965332 RepID=UPI003B59B12B
MSTITSAYNFVPINEKVCLPEWANAVSQDIPLQGSLSGVIDLTITAKTPIFVRGEVSATHANGHQEFTFMQHDNGYCIPGSSIKGTIANVLEILTFGKLKRINDYRFSHRDWYNENIYDKQSFGRRNKGGWLYYDQVDECYKIDYSIKRIGRITHGAIDAHFESKFQEIFGKDFDASTREKKDEQKDNVQFLKSARKKYELLKIDTFEFEQKFCKIPNRDDLYSIHKNDPQARKGTLVFTGQSSKREQGRNGRWQGKNKEFIFWEPDVTGIKVTEELMEDFLFAYYDHDPKERTTDWEHWREILKNKGRVPIFLQLDGNNKIKHFGLSMLYKLPFKNRIKDLLPTSHNNQTCYDFVETLFGYSVDKKSNKGRVSFQHAFAVDEIKEAATKTLILGGPKASFYPFYVAQSFHNGNTTYINGNYKTYNNNGNLAGRKRYPIKKINPSLENEDKAAFSTTFTPLAANTKFQSKIVYHNLLPVELGALLCTLTFNGVENCHHGIGMAKPYGYGAVKLDILMDEATRNKAMLAFRAYMESWWLQEKLEGTWSESEPLQELIAMARFSHQTEKLTYMELKDFPKIIQEKKALPRFTKFLGIEPFSYPESYQKEIKAFVETEKERLEAIEEAKRVKKEADAKAKAEEERKEILANGLLAWLPKTEDYGVLAGKMNEWIDMRNGECVNDETEMNYLLAIVTKLRNKKAPRFREKFLNEKKKNDLIKWICLDTAENFIKSFK